MPTAPAITCQDCHRKPAAPHSTRCPDCGGASKKLRDYYKNRQASNEFENGTAWRNCSKHLIRCNPICQRLWHGVQCHRPSVLVHHLEDPASAPAKRMDPANLVALCRQCHPNTTGDPGGIAYAPTISNVMCVTYTYPHNPPMAEPAPGSIADAMRWIAGK